MPLYLDDPSDAEVYNVQIHRDAMRMGLPIGDQSIPCIKEVGDASCWQLKSDLRM